MNRRTFLKISGASLSAVAVAPLAWAASNTRKSFHYGTSPLRALDEAGVQDLSVRRSETPFGKYEFEGGATDYFYWWFPASAPQPAPVNGFFLDPLPVVLASGIDGYSGGPVNGWSYLPLTVDCLPGFLFRSFYPIGNNARQTVLVQ